MTAMKIFILLLGFLAVIVAVIFAALENDKLDADLRAMSDAELEVEDGWECAYGHYPNIYSREIDRRAAALAAESEAAA